VGPPEVSQAPGRSRLEPGSFRDPDSRVFRAGDAVLRALSERGLADWRAVSSTSFFHEALAAGKLVGTEAVDDVELPEEALHEGVAAVLRHEPIPFVSYPYEWTFGMLKDAALLQLDLLRAALREGVTLKDASPYNVQWRGAWPVFIDVGSFEPLREGEPWAGYRQFCTLFLYPLLLQAYKDVPFQPWLRGSIDGITPQQCRNLLSFRDLFRRGVFTHVVLHSRLDRKYADKTRDVKRELKSAGFRKELIEANVRGLERLVRRLEWRTAASAWSDYSATNPYSEADAGRKAQFVQEASSTRRWQLAWDLGCNDGHYTRLIAADARYVVAVDADPSPVQTLYEALKSEGATTILPLVGNLADPSPGLGWRGVERRTLPERGRPDLTLCLALVHHLAISGNVPLKDFLTWLRELDTTLVIEFPTRDDPMVKNLLARKREGSHPDYHREWFDRCLEELFEVERSEELASGTRVLYLARPRV
jgi:SAM-dependent methyltransferase